ncbi:hypothetical protein RFI_34490, partial [Reticulomyxa filosa]
FSSVLKLKKQCDTKTRKRSKKQDISKLCQEWKKKMSKQMNVNTKNQINEHERKDIAIKGLFSVRSLKKLYEGYKTKNSNKWTLMKNIINPLQKNFNMLLCSKETKQLSLQSILLYVQYQHGQWTLQTEHKESYPNDFFSFDEIKKSILEIFRHFLHLCSIAHVQKLDAICKDRITLSFEKNVVVLHEWHTNDDVSFATSLKSVSSYTQQRMNTKTCSKIKCSHFSKQSWDEFVSKYAHQSFESQSAMQSYDQPCNLLCCTFTELTTEQINYFKHLYLQDKDDSSSPTCILVVGDGNFSFSISLVYIWPHICQSKSLELITTCYHSKDEPIQRYVNNNHAKKDYLEFFDWIIFNFQHEESITTEQPKKVKKRFVVMTDNMSCLHTNMKVQHDQFSTWNIQQAVQNIPQVQLHASTPFHCKWYPGYFATNVKGQPLGVCSSNIHIKRVYQKKKGICKGFLYNFKKIKKKLNFYYFICQTNKQ